MSIAMALRPRGATAPLLLAQLNQPLLVIWGSRDTLVPPSVRHQLQRHRPNLDLVLLEGAGHFELIDPTSASWPRVLDAFAGLLR
jgi:pimeloyl-ACP methyl ester carboxylesterase